MDFHSLFPLKEGNRWIYRTDRGSVSVQVVERQMVGTKNFYVMETRVDSELLQREKFLVDVDAFWLISRTYGDQVMLYDPPNPILIAPPEPGRSWEWKGNCGGQEYQFQFAFVERNMVRVPAGTFPCLKVEIREQGMGGKGLTSRWYSQGVGLVLESTVSDLLQYEAQLEAYRV